MLYSFEVDENNNNIHLNASRGYIEHYTAKEQQIHKNFGPDITITIDILKKEFTNIKKIIYASQPKENDLQKLRDQLVFSQGLKDG